MDRDDLAIVVGCGICCVIGLGTAAAWAWWAHAQTPAAMFFAVIGSVLVLWAMVGGRSQ